MMIQAIKDIANRFYPVVASREKHPPLTSSSVNPGMLKILVRPPSNRLRRSKIDAEAKSPELEQPRFVVFQPKPEDLLEANEQHALSLPHNLYATNKQAPPTQSSDEITVNLPLAPIVESYFRFWYNDTGRATSIHTNPQLLWHYMKQDDETAVLLLLMLWESWYHDGTISKHHWNLLVNGTGGNLSPLQAAIIYQKSPGFVEYLLRHGADVNYTDFYGTKVLHAAVANGSSLEIVQLLLQYGSVNVNGRNHWNQTPLHVAAEMCHPEMVEVLLQHGANPNCCDNRGQTAQQIMAEVCQVTSSPKKKILC